MACNCTVYVIQERSQHTVMGGCCSEHAKLTTASPIIETRQSVTLQVNNDTASMFPNNSFGVVSIRTPTIACIQGSSQFFHGFLKCLFEINHGSYFCLSECFTLTTTTPSQRLLPLLELLRSLATTHLPFLSMGMTQAHCTA